MDGPFGFRKIGGPGIATAVAAAEWLWLQMAGEQVNRGAASCGRGRRTLKIAAESRCAGNFERGDVEASGALKPRGCSRTVAVLRVSARLTAELKRVTTSTASSASQWDVSHDARGSFPCHPTPDTAITKTGL